MCSAAHPVILQAPNLITQTHSVYFLPAASPSVSMATAEQAGSRGMGGEERGEKGNVGRGGKDGRGSGEGRRQRVRGEQVQQPMRSETSSQSEQVCLQAAGGEARLTIFYRVLLYGTTSPVEGRVKHKY